MTPHLNREYAFGLIRAAQATAFTSRHRSVALRSRGTRSSSRPRLSVEEPVQHKQRAECKRGSARQRALQASSVSTDDSRVHSSL